MNRKILITLGVVLAMPLAILLNYEAAPKTPKELFEKRCSHCHDLPDLGKYDREGLAKIVHFMRSHNGAKRVISDEESVTIIDFLQQRYDRRSGRG